MPRYLLIPPSILSGVTGINRKKSGWIPTENIDLALFKKNQTHHYAVIPYGVQLIQILNKLAQHDYQIIFNEASISKQRTFLEILHDSCSRIKLPPPKIHAIVGHETSLYGGIGSSSPKIEKIVQNEPTDSSYYRVTYDKSTKTHDNLSAAREAISAFAHGIDNEWKLINDVVLDSRLEVINSAQEEGYQVVQILSQNDSLLKALNLLYTRSLTEESEAIVLNNRVGDEARKALIEQFVELKKDFDLIENIEKANHCKKATDNFVRLALSAETLEAAEYARNTYYNQLVEFSISQKVLVGAIIFAGFVLGLVGGIYLLGNIIIGAVKEDGIEARFSSILSKIGMFNLDPTQSKTDVFSKMLVKELSVPNTIRCN